MLLFVTRYVPQSTSNFSVTWYESGPPYLWKTEFPLCWCVVIIDAWLQFLRWNSINYRSRIHCDFSFEDTMINMIEVNFLNRVNGIPLLLVLLINYEGRRFECCLNAFFVTVYFLGKRNRSIINNRYFSDRRFIDHLV